MSLFSKEKYGHLIEDWAKKVEERLKNATVDEIEVAAFAAISLTRRMGMENRINTDKTLLAQLENRDESLGFGVVLWVRVKYCHTYKITPSLALLLADVIKSFGESTMYSNYMQYVAHRDKLPVIGFKEFTENVFPNCVYPSTGLWQELWGLQKLPIEKRVEMSGFAESEIWMSPDNMLDYPDCLMESIKEVK